MASGPEVELLEITIDEALRRTVEQHPERTGVVSRHQNLRLTWREMEERVEQVARGLAGLGLEPGHRVGIWSTNNLEWLLLQLGCARAGVVLVNVNPAYRSHELGYVLEKSRMRALFLRERDHRTDYRAVLDAVPTKVRGVYFDHESWDAFLKGGMSYSSRRVDRNDVTNIQYTSGTTGSPKGVLLTHRNILNNAWLIARQMRITAEDVLCMPVPLYHCFGCVMSSLLCVATGAALVMPAPSFDPLATLQAVSEERATALYGVPSMFIAELQHPRFGEFDLSSLRTGIMAGAPCPIEVMRRVVADMHCHQMTIAYGQTESSPVITMSDVGDDLELRVTTVGRAMPATEVKIVEPKTGQTLPVGELGELCTRGYLVMKGYDGNPEATADAIDAEGWLHTGDLAVMHANGAFGIRGRSRDMIIRGGENIYPREIEEFLFTHPAVAEVAVFGLPDAKFGEIVLAWVRLKPEAEATSEQIRSWCHDRIAYFKIPAEIRIVGEFPMTVTGKLQKFRMREEEIRLRGVHEVETA
ncbi:MAG: AMP-binding protein [Bryobacterales bacterium]|nr:AMP-binding protein [Bryobacterales bacterium]